MSCLVTHVINLNSMNQRLCCIQKPKLKCPQPPQEDWHKCCLKVLSPTIAWLDENDIVNEMSRSHILVLNMEVIIARKYENQGLAAAKDVEIMTLYCTNTTIGSVTGHATIELNLIRSVTCHSEASVGA